jgi:hypothetical protein
MKCEWRSGVRVEIVEKRDEGVHPLEMDDQLKTTKKN